MWRGSQRTSLPSLPHQLLTVTCLLTDQPASVVGSERVALVDVDSVGIGGRLVSAMHASRSLSSRTFNSSMYFIFKLSCFLDHLKVLRQSSASVSELLITVSSVRERQQLRLLQSWPSVHCCDCQLSISSHHPLCLAASRGSHTLSQSTQYRCHQPWSILFTRFRSAARQLDVIVSAKTGSVHGLRDVLIIRHEPVALYAGPTFPALSDEVIPNWH